MKLISKLARRDLCQLFWSWIFAEDKVKIVKFYEALSILAMLMVKVNLKKTGIEAVTVWHQRE